MNKMEVAKNEILLIYNSKDLQDREVLGYAKSLKHHKVKELDIQKHNFTELQLNEIIEDLGIRPEDLINKNSKAYLEDFKNVRLDRKGILEALEARSEMIKTPIAILNDQAEIIDSQYKLIDKDMVSKTN